MYKINFKTTSVTFAYVREKGNDEKVKRMHMGQNIKREKKVDKANNCSKKNATEKKEVSVFDLY